MPNMYYVSQTSGNDANAGTKASPFKTLSKAFFIAGATGAGITYGYSITILDSATYSVTNGTPGVSNTSNQIEAYTNWLPVDFIITAATGSIAGTYSSSPILDGGYVADFAIKHYENWTIQGITFKRFGTNAATDAAIKEVTSRQHSTVKDCTIYQITGSGVYSTKDDTELHRNTIHECSDYGFRGFGSCIVKNNIIYDCGSYGIFGGYGGSRTSNTAIEHNTVYNSPRNGSSHVSRQYAIRSASAKYNIVTSASCVISAISTTGAHSYNSVNGTYDHNGTNTPTNYSGGPGTGDISNEDPQFTDEAGNDFRIPSTSPCAEKATSSSVTIDHASGSRAWNYANSVLGHSTAKTPDLGALEVAYAAVLGVDTSVIGKVMDE